MAINERLAARIRKALGSRACTETRMFSGLAFLRDGNMLCSADEKGLLVRVGKEGQAEALAKGAEPMEMGGRTMSGFVWVNPATLDGRGLKSWLAMAERYVATLPAKTPASRTRRSDKPRKAAPRKRFA